MPRRVTGPPGRRVPSRSPRQVHSWAIIRRWGKGIVGVILVLGGIAGAITAILALRPQPDPEDSATIADIRVVSQVPLSEYAQRLAAPGPQTFRLAPSVTTKPSTTKTTGSRPVTSTTSPSQSSRKPPIAGNFLPHPALPPERLNAVADKVIERQPEICPTPLEKSHCRLASKGLTNANSVDPEGNPVPPEVAIERVLKVLKDARQNSKQEPLGAIVSVDIELAGLRGKQVLLTWSMWQMAGESRLHGDWLNRNLAYRLEATTNRDSTTVDIWIPLPATDGPFFIRVDLTTQGRSLRSGASQPFD